VLYPGFSILLGNGNGTFAAAVNYRLGTNPTSVLTGDYNGDGKTDLAILDPNSSNFAILLSKGDGTFATSPRYATAAGPVAVAIADFNGDGKSDLVVGLAAGNVAVLLGNGDGTFSAAVDYPAGSAPSGVATGDFNHDGRSDIAVANQLSGDLYVRLAQPGGTFGPATIYATGWSPLSLAAADFDGDGNVDLVTANGGSSDVSIFFGNGTGGFAPARGYGAASFAHDATIADLNGDGRMDIVVADYTAKSVAVILNSGTCAAIASVLPAVGTVAGGQTVILNGTHLAGATSVTFGGSAATITANTPSSITVKTPPHASDAATVTAITLGGTSTAAFTFSQADISVSETVSPPLYYATQNVTYTIAIANHGPLDATNVTLTDPLPSGAALVSAQRDGDDRHQAFRCGRARQQGDSLGSGDQSGNGEQQRDR
jgi:uncharacterized repeat protein (TIGR01451 family)